VALALSMGSFGQSRVLTALSSMIVLWIQKKAIGQ
jgi:hypothetical protein